MSQTLSQFHHSVTGPESGRRWVFLHGLMGYSQNWRRIVLALEKTEQCLVFDQRGHGRSFKPVNGFSPEDYASDLNNILNELGWDKIILVGHSMGGRNAMAFAALYPEKMLKLVVEDMGPEKRENAHLYYQHLLDSVPTPFVNREAAKSFFANEFSAKVSTKEREGVLSQFLYANMEEKQDGSIDWRFSKDGIIKSVIEGRTSDRWAYVPKINCPTLLIRGQNSSEFPRESYEKMLEMNPQFQGLEIPNAGHWVHSEQPELFVEAIKRFTSM
ncbi:MAG: alpha/beta hydrolase [Bdellovibrionota bacterium]